MTSVIIPAHDEERRIGATLEALLRDAGPDEFEVVVVLNGCRDRTEAVVRSFAPAVRVVVLGESGKTRALNAGDQAATRFPRIYLDADVVMPTATARALTRELSTAAPMWAAPTPVVALNGASALVRTHAKTWYALSRLRDDLGGTGVYAMNAAARALFGRFPEIIADDLYIRRQLAAVRKVRVPEHVVVRPPRRLRDLLLVRTRVHLGNYQHAIDEGNHPGLSDSGLDALRQLAREPGHWPGLASYTLLESGAKVAALRRLRSGRLQGWDRDTSTRR